MGGQAAQRHGATVGAPELYVFAAIVLGIGAAIGIAQPATVFTLLAATLAIAGFAVSARRRLTSTSSVLVVILAIGIAANVLILFVVPMLLVEFWHRPILALIGVAALGALFLARLRRALVLVAVLGYFALSAGVLTALERPHIDVHLFQQEGSRALIALQNPYELRYRNIYGEGTDLYAFELQMGDYLNFGFPYPPLSLAMALPGYVVAGDFRYSSALAVSITTILLAFMRLGPVSAGVGLLYMLSPLTLAVVVNGWTEPFVAVLLAATVYAATRFPRTTPLLLGLLIASKQYVLPVLLPAVVILAGVRRLTGTARLILVPLAVAAVTVVPFLLWNPPEFIHSVVLLQAYQPFRMDSVSVTGLMARMDLGLAPAWLAFVGGGLTLLAVSRFAPRTPAGFAGATAVFFFVFFMLSKQAFMNYYYLVLVAMACAVAAHPVWVAATHTAAVATSSPPTAGSDTAPAHS